MHNQIFCPHCRGILTIEYHVVFSARRKNGQKGLLLLSPELGDYTIHHDPAFDIQTGEALDLYCPICHARLTFSRNKNLVRVKMFGAGEQEFDIYFSRIMGEHSTYMLEGDNVKAFGEHSSVYKEYLELMRYNHPYRNL